MHCQQNYASVHENGYDLCNVCALKRLEFREFGEVQDNILNIQRDHRYPIVIATRF